MGLENKDNSQEDINPIYTQVDTKTSLLINIPKEKINQYATDTTKFTKNKNYFHVMDHSEPHTVRRSLILNDHPEIEKLFIDKEPIYTLLFVGVIHVIQFFTCFLIFQYEITWIKIILFSSIIGAIFNHGLFVLYHDITHFNCLKSVKLNQIFAIICNLPQIIPSAIGFGRYHRDHHSYLGHPINDPDIPTTVEIQMFQSSWRRILYLFLMPFFYGLRPYFKAPKQISFMEVINIICCFGYTILIGKLFTVKAVIYLLLCTYFGLSLHPVCYHVIAEHYEFFKSQDTYSYYGIINWINFNMGYHIEHHDFPNIPWYKLPEVRKIAPEYYENLPQIDSYLKVMYDYLFDGEIGPWSRIVLNDVKKQ